MPRAVHRSWAPVVLALVVVAAGCVPWVVGENAETVPPGSVRFDAGLAALTPPDQPQRVLPVPQARIVVGVREGLDAAVAYVPPLTGHGRLRLRAYQGPGVAVAAAVGWGVHGVPDLVGVGEVIGVPFATAEVHVSQRGAGPRWYGALRAVLPYYPGDPPAATLWIAPQVGLELEGGGLVWGPELGVVVPTTHPTETQLVLGLAGRWRP